MVGPYPNLFDAETLDALPKSVRGGCARVKARTGATAFYDVFRSALCFGYKDPAGSPSILDILVPVRTSGSFDPALDKMRVNGVEHPAGIDDVVRFIQMAKISPELKATWRKWRELTQKHDDQEWADRSIEAKAGEVMGKMERSYERFSMGRHYRRTHLVNGLK